MDRRTPAARRPSVQTAILTIRLGGIWTRARNTSADRNAMSEFFTDLKLLRDVSRLDCIECGAAWSDPSEKWRMYATNDAPAERELGLFCPDCASREFDG
jgi:hypothetical protein